MFGEPLVVSSVQELIRDVANARQRFLTAVGEPTSHEAMFKPAPETWSIVDVVEHITLAEHVGINGIWKALEGVRSGRPVWDGNPVHRGKPIEAVITSTWREREDVPAIAAPRWGGPLSYWIAALQGCQPVLVALGRALEGVDLSTVIYPHPISGPLDARQRLEFLRFHLERHSAQITRIREAPGYSQASRGTA
jgi:hypothetical protein